MANKIMKGVGVKIMKKNKLANDLLRKTVAGLLALALILSGICFLPTDAEEAQAAGTSHVEQLEISRYKESNVKAPKPTNSEYKDWIFAGWYTDRTCEIALDKNTVSGSYYAKFIPAEVLSIRCQIPVDTNEGTTGTSKLRIVSTVDSLRYSKVGFRLEIANNAPIDYNTTTVYSSIKVTGDGVPFAHQPSVFDDMSKYFITATITNIPSTEFATGIRITPYWVTLDGTEVYGVSRYARVEDGYLDIVNIPVRLYTDAEVAAGSLTVDYNEEIFEFFGWDAGTVFDEMKTAEVNGKVRCVGLSGEITDTTGNVTADGMYANLRFRLKDGKTLPGSSSFTVSGENFCNQAEQSVTQDVSDVVYKNMN